MDLIDLLCVLQNLPSNHQTSIQNQSILSNFFQDDSKLGKEDFEKLVFRCFVKKIQSKLILADITLFPNLFFQLTISFMDNLIFHGKSIEQINKLTKYFLKFNGPQEKFFFKINPISRCILLSMQIGIPFSNYLANLDILYIIQECLQDICNLSQNYYTNILFLINQGMQDMCSDDSEQCKNIKLAKQLKTYSKSSCYYTWNILEAKTKSKNCLLKQTYQQQKSKFRRLRRSINFNNFSHSLKKCYFQLGDPLMPFFCLKIDEDEQLQKNYLSNLKIINKSQKLINLIELSKTQQQFLLQNKWMGYNISQHKKIHLSLRNMTTDKFQNQNLVIQKLPNTEYIGLPKYFINKNMTKKYIITNCHAQSHLQKYFQKNSITISLRTKYYILSQIGNTLKYLRDFNMLYHNLSPFNVNVKKGLAIKLTDLSNTYNEQSIQSSFSNLFPYVSNIINFGKRSIDDQRSDSYSLGVLAYELISKKKIFDIKESKIASLSQNEKFDRLSNQMIFSLEKLNYLGNNQLKSLYHFIFQAISHKIQYQIIQKRGIKLGLRPYLDWHLIIFKHLLNSQS